jgi:hypothetical protein
MGKSGLGAEFWRAAYPALAHTVSHSKHLTAWAKSELLLFNSPNATAAFAHPAEPCLAFLTVFNSVECRGSR